MNMTEIKQLAKDRGVVPGKLRKVDLIHRLQAQNPQCYITNTAQDCGQPNCIWRPDCD